MTRVVIACRRGLLSSRRLLQLRFLSGLTRRLLIPTTVACKGRMHVELYAREDLPQLRRLFRSFGTIQVIDAANVIAHQRLDSSAELNRRAVYACRNEGHAVVCWATELSWSCITRICNMYMRRYNKYWVRPALLLFTAPCGVCHTTLRFPLLHAPAVPGLGRRRWGLGP